MDKSLECGPLVSAVGDVVGEDGVGAHVDDGGEEHGGGLVLPRALCAPIGREGGRDADLGSVDGDDGELVCAPERVAEEDGGGEVVGSPERGCGHAPRGGGHGGGRDAGRVSGLVCESVHGPQCVSHPVPASALVREGSEDGGRVEPSPPAHPASVLVTEDLDDVREQAVSRRPRAVRATSGHGGCAGRQPRSEEHTG